MQTGALSDALTMWVTRDTLFISSLHGYLHQTVAARHVLAAKEAQNAGGREIFSWGFGPFLKETARRDDDL